MFDLEFYFPSRFLAQRKLSESDANVNMHLRHTLSLSPPPTSARFCLSPRQWGAADAEMKVPFIENTESLKVLPLKPGVGQYIAMHATLTARDFFLANF